jgi:hypothetical protein
MATIVKGHGARVDDTTTFVPNGTTVKFYSDFDVNLATSSALVAITSGSFASPNDEADEGSDIANYRLYKQDDRFYAQWIAMGGEAKTPIWWVGQDLPDQIRLCNLDGTCDPGSGLHNCTGVFGQVKDSEIILLACRGVLGAHGGSTAEFGSDEEDPLHDVNADMNEWFGGFISRLQADPDKAEAEYDALPQGTKALALATGYGEAFSYGRWIRRYALDDDLDNLFTHLKQNAAKSGNMMWLVNNVASCGAALDAAVARHPGNFKDFLDTAGDPWRTALMARPAIATAIGTVAAAEAPSIDWAEFQGRNREFVKNMAEGDGAVFWQYDEVLVIGGQYRHPYGAALLEAGGSEGTLTMLERGGVVSRGSVEVSGAADQDAFKRAFGELSAKTVKFV